jgi:hypothetical protein
MEAVGVNSISYNERLQTDAEKISSHVSFFHTVYFSGPLGFEEISAWTCHDSDPEENC